MTGETRKTRFAPAERADGQTVRQQAESLAEDTTLRRLYDAVTESIVIVNPQRQIVFCNRRFMETVGASKRGEVYGLRPGEAIGCIHAFESEGGCGTSEACSTCGAVNAFLESRQGGQQVQECHILTSEGGDALDLLVRATPLQLESERFTIIALTDIGHRKRRRALERVFFHDLMNRAMGLRLLARNLRAQASEEIQATAGDIARETTRMLREIRAQRDLALAEDRELPVYAEPVASRALLEELVESHQAFAADHDCRLRLKGDSADAEFVTDPRILSRVLVNMIRNAVEASEPGGTVTTGCRKSEQSMEFWVHNETHMPREVQLKIFKRSFSTKEPGRGLGTYSMKLLSERYLEGTVSFSSSPQEGTTFVASYPASLP